MLFDNEDKFDYLIASEILEHVGGLNNVMLGMKNLLKENGIGEWGMGNGNYGNPIQGNNFGRFWEIFFIRI